MSGQFYALATVIPEDLVASAQETGYDLQLIWT